MMQEMLIIGVKINISANKWKGKRCRHSQPSVSVSHIKFDHSIRGSEHPCAKCAKCITRAEPIGIWYSAICALLVCSSSIQLFKQKPRHENCLKLTSRITWMLWKLYDLYRVFNYNSLLWPKNKLCAKDV